MLATEFIEKFAEAIDVEASELTNETEFRNLNEWDSMAYLSVIAMIDEEYDMQIEQLEFMKLHTLQELMDYIETHK